MPTAVAPFSLDSFDQSPAPDTLGASFGRVAITKTFTGDITGTSVVDMMSVANDAGPLAYVAVEQFEVTVAGKTGAFAMQHLANFHSGTPNLTYLIIEGSGTGDLAGIRGTGAIDIAEDGAHTLTLDYELA